MTAIVVGHFTKMPLAFGHAPRALEAYLNADLYLSVRHSTPGQLWERIGEGKRRD